MNIFYAILSVVFGVFTYLVATENETSTGRAILLAVFMFLFWPIAITVAMVYLLVMKLRKRNTVETEVVDEQKEWNNLDNDVVDDVVDVLEEDAAETEEAETEEATE